MVDLHTAAKEGDTSVIIQAIGRGDDINARDKLQRTPLLLGAWAGQTDAVKLLLAKEGCNVNAGAVDDVNALHFAAQKGHTEIIRLLLNAGLHVNSRTRKGVTALHFAAQYGHLEAVKFLISRKANIQATTAKQQTPYQMAKDQAVKAVLAVASEEAAARLSAAAEERPDTESRRQRNAHRKRGKQSREEREEELEGAADGAAGTDDLDPPTIGPGLPHGRAGKHTASAAGEDADDTIVAPAEQRADTEEANDTVIGPVGPPAGFKPSVSSTPGSAVVHHTGDSKGGDQEGDDAEDEGEEDGDEGQDLNGGAAIGPVGPPVGFKRKAADADVSDAVAGKVHKPLAAAAITSNKHAGKMVDAKMVLSFMGDDEDED